MSSGLGATTGGARVTAEFRSPGSKGFREYATTRGSESAGELDMDKPPVVARDSAESPSTGAPKDSGEVDAGRAPRSGREARVLSWRLEINRRKSPSGEYWFHWIYRITLPEGNRKSQYGGSLDRLPYPERLTQYERNSKRYARRNHGKEKA